MFYFHKVISTFALIKLLVRNSIKSVMKKNMFKSIAALLLSGLVLAGCNGLGKMAKNAPDINFYMEPSPLIVRGDSVEVTVKGNFPPGLRSPLHARVCILRSNAAGA